MVIKILMSIRLTDAGPGPVGSPAATPPSDGLDHAITSATFSPFFSSSASSPVRHSPSFPCLLWVTRGPSAELPSTGGQWIASTVFWLDDTAVRPHFPAGFGNVRKAVDRGYDRSPAAAASASASASASANAQTARYCTVTLQHLRSRDVDDLKEARLLLIYPPRPTYTRPTCLSFLCLTARYASPSLDLVSRRPRGSPLGSSPEARHAATLPTSMQQASNEFLLYKQSSHLPIAAVAEPSAGHGGALRARAIQGPDASPRLH
ncbi:hypothetical protein K456DRAFT_1764873 [Colletotrichum gloeosporioides 23]|nr:hypothetical protein K456DRAFT_1764873 [Colletotrichum gloeosporioides 23]